MDRVFIEALDIECVIGIYDWERKIRQPVSLDIEMSFDNKKPAASDDIADTLDYKAISKRLIDFVGASSYGLVEALAEQCCRIIVLEFGVSKVKLKLSKVGAVRGAKAVGVKLKRSRKDYEKAGKPETALHTAESLESDESDDSAEPAGSSEVAAPRES